MQEECTHSYTLFGVDLKLTQTLCKASTKYMLNLQNKKLH